MIDLSSLPYGTEFKVKCRDEEIRLLRIGTNGDSYYAASFPHELLDRYDEAIDSVSDSGSTCLDPDDTCDGDVVEIFYEKTKLVGYRFTENKPELEDYVDGQLLVRNSNSKVLEVIPYGGDWDEDYFTEWFSLKDVEFSVKEPPSQSFLIHQEGCAAFGRSGAESREDFVLGYVLSRGLTFSAEDYAAVRGGNND